MTRQKKILIIAAATLLLYLVAAIALGAMSGLTGGRLWILRIGLTLFGIASAALIVWFFRPRAAEAPRDDLDAAVAAARTRLTAARGRSASLRTLPAVLVIGSRGSAKTTAVVRSQLEPDLLAGDVFRGEAVAPTSGANLWFAQDTLVIEADGDAIADAARWKRFVRHLRPRRLAAAVTGGVQAPRVAVVCVSCEEFYRPNGGEEMSKLARLLRERLGELAHAFGIRLPVYVLFTKADTIPHFDSYLRNLSQEEAREVIGAAVAPDDGPAGTYADRATPRLENAWFELHRSLAMARLRFLPREGESARRLDGYEFPREIRKITPIAVDFLRELCKPAQLAVSPVLRGFWLTGVQAVVIPNVMGAEFSQPARAAASSARSATGVFSGLSAAGATPAMPQSAPRERKTARWVALPRFFHDVVLGDAAAFDLARGGTHLDYLRRTLLATGIAAVLLLATAFTVSFSRNRSLERDVREAARSFAALPVSDVDLPAVGALQRLDSLRAWVDSLRRWQSDGAPMRLRWGLYPGSAIYPAARRAYFAGFDRVLFHGTRSAMVAAMRALPDAPRPADEYEPNYNLLRAYLITTTQPRESTVDFMRPVLTTRWLDGRRADSTRQQLAERQFETYAAELRAGNPYDATADAAAVARARAFLRQFAGSEHIYQYMLTEASRTNPPVSFNRNVPGSAAVVPVTAEVPGAFTKKGWEFMQGALKNIDRFFARDSWVLGDDGRVEGDRARIAQEIQARYTTDYIEAWRRFLAAASVTRFASVKDASQKLAVLSGNQSPLLALLATVSRETAVGTPAIATAFQSVQQVVPPDTKDKLIVEPIAPYVNALVALQSSLDQVAGQQGPASEAAAGQAQSNAISARTASHQITAAFTLAADAKVNASVQRLLDAPIANVEPLVRNFGALEINSRARLFCATLRPMLARFPFNPDATAEVSLAEVTTLLRPGTGTLWTFYEGALQSAMPKQGSRYVQGSGPRLSSGFVQLFNRLAVFSEALFHDDAAEIRQRWTVQPRIAEGTSSVRLTVDGQSARSTKNALETVAVTWPARGRESKLTAQLGGTEYTLAGPYKGTWGAFRLFYDADAWFPEGSGSRAEWALGTRAGRATAATGETLRISVDIDAGPMTPALRRGYFTGSCTGNIAG